MRTLYFDIDGTVLLDNDDRVKAELGGGRFEDAVRAAGFSRVVCVGNFAEIAHAARAVNPSYDGLGMLFRLCRGAFRDESWLRARTVLVSDPEHRADHIDYGGDWWYVDDLAEHYLRISGREDVFLANVGTRIFVPDPRGTGRGVLTWLRSLPAPCETMEDGVALKPDVEPGRTPDLQASPPE